MQLGPSKQQESPQCPSTDIYGPEISELSNLWTQIGKTKLKMDGPNSSSNKKATMPDQNQCHDQRAPDDMSTTSKPSKILSQDIFDITDDE